MRIIEPMVLVEKGDAKRLLKKIEMAGRVCYKTEDKITDDSYSKFIEDKVLGMGHQSIVEHSSFTVKVICDRGVSHEIVRHRLAAYSQESTRYCNYGTEKFGGGITLINPFFFPQDTEEFNLWCEACECIENIYLTLLRKGKTAQEARSVLPNSLKTEIVITYNLREWMHFFKLRAARAAHPQMRQIAIPLLMYMKNHFAPLFDNIDYDHEFVEVFGDKLAKVIEVEDLSIQDATTLL